MQPGYQSMTPQQLQVLQQQQMMAQQQQQAAHLQSQQQQVNYQQSFRAAPGQPNAFQQPGAHMQSQASYAGQQSFQASAAGSGSGSVPTTGLQAGDQNLHNALVKAVRSKDPDQVRAALEGGCNVNSADAQGFTALHWAAQGGDGQITNLLLTKGADVNKCNHQRDTPLHYACAQGAEQVVAVLLTFHANGNMPNSGGSTALHYACSRNHQRIALTLVMRGASVQIRNSQAHTPLDQCQPDLRSQITDLITRHSMRQQQQQQPGAHLASQAPNPAAHASVAPHASMTPQQQALLQQQQMQARQRYIQQQQQQQQQSGFGGGANGMQPSQVPPPPAPADDKVEVVVGAKIDVGGAEAGVDEPAAVEISGAGSKREKKYNWEVDFEDIKIEQFLGKGGFGEVHKGTWRATPVAVKRLLSQNVTKKILDEFCSEVEVMSRMRHPNIVLFMGACLTQPNICIVTEFLKKGSLYSVLHSKSIEITWQRMIGMALDSARGMAYLHGFKPCIMHRDLKSLNILVGQHWDCRIADFGLTVVKSGSYANTQCGTPQWMSPEVLQGGFYDEKADVYSFAIVLWEMYTRREPYQGLQPMQVGVQVLLHGLRPTVPSHCPGPLRNLILQCWAQDPKQRPSFPDIINTLEWISDNVPAQATKIGHP